MRRWSIALILLTFGCQSTSERTQREPGPFEGLELAQSSSVQEVDEQLPVLWLTSSAVVLGSQTLARVSKGRLLSPDEVAAVRRAVSRSTKSRRALALGVDRRLHFGQVRQLIAAALRSDTSALELRLVGRESSKVIRVCALFSGGLPDIDAPEDCWGQPAVRAPRPSTDAGPETNALTSADGGDHADATATRTSAQGDISSNAPRFDWSAPLRLNLSVEEDYLLVRVQERTLRTLPFGRGVEEGGRLTPARLLQTLENLRSNNSWDRAASMRVADGVCWEELIPVLDMLREVRFDRLTIINIGAGD